MSLAQYLLPNKELAWMMGWVIFCGGVKLNKRFRFREVINMLVVEEIYTSPALLCRQSDKTQENFTIFGFYSLSLTTTTYYLFVFDRNCWILAGHKGLNKNLVQFFVLK